MKKEIKILVIILSIMAVGGGITVSSILLKPNSSKIKEATKVEEVANSTKEDNKEKKQSVKDEKKKQNQEEKMEKVSQDEWLQAYREAEGIENSSFFLFYFSKNSLVPYLITGPTIYHYENGEAKIIVTDILATAPENMSVYVDDSADIMLIESEYNWFGECVVINTNSFEMIDEFRWFDSGARDSSSYLEYSSMGTPITSYDYEQKMKQYESYQKEKCMLGSSLTDGSYSFYYDRE